MGEGLVGLGHAVHVLTTLDRGAQAVGGVQNLVHKTLAASAARVRSAALQPGPIRFFALCGQALNRVLETGIFCSLIDSNRS